MAFLIITFWLLTLVVLISLALFGAGRIGRTLEGEDQPHPGPDAGLDAAEEELRLRYARGEIGREEFLQRKIDLER